ncbi:Branched-chain-amino-acid aminotransferase, cytosolic [Bagarius yarrelli]|uniref:Branched-chain-amino-acid aminotransferase n=1 Tax=Bagarius yarrelli TaxID=175774 RepID=A0A556V3C4_BAGYA|nr:Branched-chain-amino-acid aminotransferase, cytosolic [Bagarius yarrelli]
MKKKEKYSSTKNPRSADTVVQLCESRKPKPEWENLSFGTVFTDHMLLIEWSSEGGWGKPRIQPFGNLSLHPACSALHYAVQLFEGMKAYRGQDGRIRLFRPMLNMQRMLKSAHRACLPSFDGAELLDCIRKLVNVDQDWVPHSDSASLYIRPTFLGTESSLGVKKASRALLFVILSPVGSYFSTGNKSVSLWADSKYIRAWKGGTGDCKMGGNYGASIYAQYEAQDFGCQQVLWLYGDDHQITEVGTMNLFLYWINEDGEEELATPPLDGIILPGITRQSILELTSKWRRVKELFGSGTACVVSRVCGVLYQGQKLQMPTAEQDNSLVSRLLKELTDIQVRKRHTHTHTHTHMHHPSFSYFLCYVPLLFSSLLFSFHFPSFLPSFLSSSISSFPLLISTFLILTLSLYFFSSSLQCVCVSVCVCVCVSVCDACLGFIGSQILSFPLRCRSSCFLSLLLQSYSSFSSVDWMWFRRSS